MVLGRNEDTFTKEVFCDNLCFMAIEDLKEPLRVFAKIRYNHKGALCRLYQREKDVLECVFDEPQ